MALNFEKIVTDKIVSVSGYSKSTGSCLFILDELKDGTFDNGSEKVFGTGAGGTRISALDRNKTAKFSCTNGFLVGGTIAAQVGTTVTEETSMLTPALEYITLGATPITALTKYKATGVVGAEIKLYKANPDGSLGKEYVQAETASVTAYAYAPATKTITVPTSDFATGDVIIVTYNYNAQGKKISNKANSFPKAGRIVVDVLCKDVCDNNVSYHAMFVFPNASIDGNFSIGIGNEPAVHAFSCEALNDICSTDKTYWDLLIPDGEAV